METSNEVSKISYQVESYKQCFDEVFKMLPEHHEELTLSKDIPLDPDFDVYEELAEDNKLLVITCRKDKELIGYIVFFVIRNIHYKSCIIAKEDIYYLKKEYRKGRVGIRMFQFAEDILRGTGVNRIVYGTKTYSDNSKLFEYLGYTHFEKLYNKFI